MNNDLISREALKEEIATLCRNINAKYAITIPTSAFTRIIDNAPSVEGRMVYVQETVNTILNSCTGNTDIDKAFRNSARFVQNAIDGKSVDFEEIERSDEEGLQGEWIEGENGIIKCNQCGCEIRFLYLIGNKPDLPKFCCDCGAKMKGGAE